MMNVRKVSTLVAALALLGLAATQFSGCEKYVLPEVTLSQDTLWFHAAAGTQSIHVTTNVVTTAEPETDDQFGLATDPVWFDESCNVTVTVLENTGDSRTATIPIKSEAILKNLVVIQEGIQIPGQAGDGAL